MKDLIDIEFPKIGGSYSIYFHQGELYSKSTVSNDDKNEAYKFLEILHNRGIPNLSGSLNRDDGTRALFYYMLGIIFADSFNENDYYQSSKLGSGITEARKAFDKYYFHKDKDMIWDEMKRTFSLKYKMQSNF